MHPDYMPPGPSFHDAIDCRSRNGVSFAYLGVGYTSGMEFEDFNDFGLVKLGETIVRSLWCFLTEPSVRMKPVFGTRTPLKIILTGLALDSVFVIYVSLAGDRFKKRIRDEPVDCNPTHNTAVAQTCIGVPIGIDMQLKYSLPFASRTLLSADPSKIRNTVDSFVTFNWTPFFGSVIKWFGHNLHLSVDCVLAAVSGSTLSAVNCLCQFVSPKERTFYG